MIHSPFEKIGTWFIAGIIWFVSVFVMYGQSDILHTNFLLIYSVALGCVGVYLLIVYLAYKSEVKTEEKNRQRVEYIKNKFPNAYQAYLSDNHIRYSISYETIALISDADWANKEEKAVSINKEYDKIRFKYHKGFEAWIQKQGIKDSHYSLLESNTKLKVVESHKEIAHLDKELLLQNWINEQRDFSSFCRDLHDEVIPTFGCYKYSIQYPGRKNASVWQLFFYSYCLDKSLDYSLNNHSYYLKTAEIVEQHSTIYNYDGFIKGLCSYIGKLKEKGEISIYLNLSGEWDNSIRTLFGAKVLAELDSGFRHKNVYTNPNPYADLMNSIGVKVPSYEEWAKNVNKYIVIIDLVTENKQINELCSSILKQTQSKQTLLIYFSLFKCFSSEEMVEIIEKDQKKAESLKNEEAERLEKLKKMNLDEIPVEEDPIPDIGDSSEEYELGIPVAETEIIRVNYDLPPCNDRDSYCFYIAPDKYSIIFPYRNHRVERRGYTELKFEQRLRQELKYNDNYVVLGDVSILVSDGYHPYEPDIVIAEKVNKFGIRIDIEIDEPYSGYENKPIHYLGCGDDRRDKTLADLGWLVVRFSEKQIFNEPYNCIYYIKQLISQIDDSFLSSVNGILPQSVKRWTKEESEEMIQSKSREKLLNHIFSAQEVERSTKRTSILITQSEHEKQISGKVETIINNENYQDETIKESSKEKVVTKTKIVQREIHNIPSSNIYSNSFVDLGLSVKWASCNLGAERPEDFGNYYAWAETTPKRSYNWGSYKYLIGSTSVFNKYNNNDKFGDIDNIITLLPEDDVANVCLGGKCRVPTKRELLELMAECYWEKTSINGVYGYKITSKKEGFEDRSIFLPAAGCCDNDNLINFGGCGYYWNSTLFEGNPTLAYKLRFDSEGIKWSYSSRRMGLSIRPVCP